MSNLSAPKAWFQSEISRLVVWITFKGDSFVVFWAKSSLASGVFFGNHGVMPGEETDQNRGESVEHGGACPGRDARGRFSPGSSAGPGRPASWSTLIRRALTNEVRQRIVQAAVERACDGCPESRAWLLRAQDGDLSREIAAGLSKAAVAIAGGSRRPTKSAPLLSEQSSPANLPRRADGKLDVEALRASGFTDWQSLSLDDWLSIDG